ncbi:hypothetical protein SK128_020799 [Halocaridina rubra]|uniref:C2H2-type domain-containing protein n=1 Tax=Halocaridina rubra TaxID=373956 RepID=A0AAN8ZUI8_HALRR
MSSSSIEVMGMGGSDMKVMLLENSIHDEEMAQRMQDIIHSTGPPGHIIDTGPPITQHPVESGQEEEFAQINEFETIDGVDPPPGTIIFSPQDLVRPMKTSSRGRGRGRGGIISSIKQETQSTPQVINSSGLEVSVACEICGKYMMTGKTLVQHMAIHSDLKPFQCPHCPKSFTRKVHLQGHLVIHGIEKQFECPICHQRFSRQDCVKVHMRLHDKSQCVYCDVCHKAFLTVGALNIHLRIHRGEKPFKCHLCSKCFTQKNHLITHIKRHTKVTDEHFTKKLGPRMFKCEHCTRAFIRLSDYERHVQWNHGAVADGSIIDKLPTVGNLLDGEMKQTGVAPQVFKAPKDALKNKVARYHKTAKRSRVTMCTTSTQTDEDGGHVIIPRMYQNRVSAGTQVSAPPTPRRTEEDMYENDIFDEGMDRNYSSEDEDDPEEMEQDADKPLYAMAETSDMASDPVRDAAFDAIVQGSSTMKVPTSFAATTTVASGENNTVFLQEASLTTSKQDLDVREREEMEDEEDENEEQGTIYVKTGVEKDGEYSDKEKSCNETPEKTHIPKQENEEREVVLDDEEIKRVSHAQDICDKILAVQSESEDRSFLQERQERTEIVNQLRSDEENSQEASEAMITVNSLNGEDMTEQSQEGLLNIAESSGFPRSEPSKIMTPEKLSMHVFQPKSQSKEHRGRGRPRGRGRAKLFWYGLTGAAELRAIRKSMLQRIQYASQENKEEEPMDDTLTEETEEATLIVSNEEGESEGRVRRMAKKQHGKDFVCNMKNCETCSPSPKPAAKVQNIVKTKVKMRDKDPDDAEVTPVKKTITVSSKGQSPKPINKLGSSFKGVTKPIKKPLMPSEKASSPLSDMAMPNIYEKTNPLAKKICLTRPDQVSDKREEFKMKVGNRVGLYPVDITANLLTSKKPKKPDYFVATNKSESIVSPPVELKSFCIPTYSCKLCGREFRFEGKLHRHIESIHQNKAIFSDDVKPGRSSAKGVINVEPCFVNALEEIPIAQPPVEPENPEIAALRSEWDDDDDDDDEEPEPVPIKTSVSAVSTAGATFKAQPFTIVTREITPVTTTVTSSQYTSGVKVNMNKLAGLLLSDDEMPETRSAELRESSVSRISANSSSTRLPRDPEIIMGDTLDSKCRRLLEKLFDHALLMSCGLIGEHVSVVLGKVLQHYGVKMIEDYGQGQYEVLKYNLWRLIEWKVTMEQMEEFYTAGKSVEEMMDDIMNERVPLVSHHFVPHEQKANPPPQVSQAGQVTQMEAVEVTDGQMVLQQVAGVLGGQINLPEGVTQVVLAQDVSPELLQGAHIVTIDPTTGQVISQVTADQVILTDAIGDNLEQQVAALDGQVVVSQAHIVDPNVTQENIVVPQSSAISVHGGQGQVMIHTTSHQQSLKLETGGHATARQTLPHHQ